MHCHWLEVLVYDCSTLSTTGHSFWALTVYFGCSHSSSNLGVITFGWDSTHLYSLIVAIVKCWVLYCENWLESVAAMSSQKLSYMSHPLLCFLYVQVSHLSMAKQCTHVSYVLRILFLVSLLCKFIVLNMSAYSLCILPTYTHTHAHAYTHACMHACTHTHHTHTHTQSCHLNWEIHLA